MAKVDILIKTDGTTATSSELNSSNGNAGNSAESTEAIAPNGTGSERHLITRSVFAQRLASTGVNALKTTFMFAKNNYGNFTGDYLGQQKIDAAFSTAMEVASFGEIVFGGSMIGGFNLAAVVTSIIAATVNQGINYGQAKFNEQMQLSRANAQANYNSQRIGVILVNGNR